MCDEQGKKIASTRIGIAKYETKVSKIKTKLKQSRLDHQTELDRIRSDAQRQREVDRVRHQHVLDAALERSTTCARSACCPSTHSRDDLAFPLEVLLDLPSVVQRQGAM